MLQKEMAQRLIASPGNRDYGRLSVMLQYGADVKVVALSMHSDRRLVGEMLRAGASAFVLKDCAFDELFGAIRSVVARQRYLSPKIVGIVVEDYVRRSPSPDSPVFSALTQRQREVLQLIAEGLCTAEIARALHVSVKTVETHRKQIMQKLHGMVSANRYRANQINQLAGQLMKNQIKMKQIELQRFQAVKKLITARQLARLLIALPRIERRIRRLIRRAQRHRGSLWKNAGP